MLVNTKSYNRYQVVSENLRDFSVLSLDVQLSHSLKNKMVSTEKELIISLLVGAILCIGVWACAACWRTQGREEQSWDLQQRNYGSSDHDDQKRKYETRDEALGG